MWVGSSNGGSSVQNVLFVMSLSTRWNVPRTQSFNEHTVSSSLWRIGNEASPKFPAEEQWQWQWKQNVSNQTKKKREEEEEEDVNSPFTKSICRTIELSFWYFVIWLSLSSNRKSCSFLAARKSTDELRNVKLWARMIWWHIYQFRRESFWIKTIFFFMFCSTIISKRCHTPFSVSTLLELYSIGMCYFFTVLHIHAWQFVNAPYHYAYDVRIKWIKIISIFLFCLCIFVGTIIKCYILCMWTNRFRNECKQWKCSERYRIINVQKWNLNNDIFSDLKLLSCISHTNTYNPANAHTRARC